ncbi:MAG: hypothetical protein PVJ83_04290 [Gammaproteobacteria bacterium]|jgi:hypothetical protein
MEHTLLKTVSLAWLVLALLVAPLRALASPDHSGCPMSDNRQHVSDQHHHALAGDTDPGTVHCPQCAQTGCKVGVCHHPGCCVLHLTPGPIASTLVFRVAAPDTFMAPAGEKRASLPPSPPYRPPV